MRKPKVKKEPTLDYINCIDYLLYKKLITRDERDHFWHELFEQGVSNGNDKYFHLHFDDFPIDGKDVISTKVSSLLFKTFNWDEDHILFWMCW